MKKTLLFVLLGFLAWPLVSCGSSLLRLERSGTPAGPWEQVPANELPITAEGAFEDQFDGDQAYYQMRIDKVSDGLRPPFIEVVDLPQLPVTLAQGLLDSMRDLGGDNSWEGAELAPLAFPVYDPLIEGPRFMEFKIIWTAPLVAVGGAGTLSQSPSLPRPTQRDSNAGFILVSMTEDDLPILEYSTQGLTQTEQLRLMAKSSAVRLFRYGDGFLAAENEKGELVASIGAPPLYWPDEILEYCDRQFEASISLTGEIIPEPLPIEATPYASYQAFKEDWGKSKLFQLVRERRKQDAKIFWDIHTGRIEKMIIYVTLRLATTAYDSEAVQSFTLADPTLADVRILTLGVSITGKKLGTTSYHAVFKGGGTADGYVAVVERQPLSPEKPTTTWNAWTVDYAGTWDQQRRYDTSNWCASTGVAAWANLYGWFDYTGRAPNLIEGTAALYNNAPAIACMWWVRDVIGYFCITPWLPQYYDTGFVPYGYDWAKERGCGYSVHAAWGAPCYSSPSALQLARDSIVIDGRPTIIGVGSAPNRYYVAFGYASRQCTGTYGEVWASEAKFLCNMGLGGDAPEWINASGVVYGQRNNFW